MARKNYPLELVLRAHGTAELLNADQDILWASDSDDDFREEFNDEFLNEDDIPDILEFLYDQDILTDKELDFLENELWVCNVETLETNMHTGPDDEDDDDDDENEEE